MPVYVLAVEGQVVKYPYTLTDLRRDNPTVSFPADISDSLAQDFNVFVVSERPQPSYNPETETLSWVNPTFNSNVWEQNWAVTPLSSEEIAQRLQQWRQSTSCSPFQGRMALADANLLPQAQAAVDAADEKTRVAWEYALEWSRMSPMIATLAPALNLSDAQVDELFRAAIQIEA
jgi:hypothetical protein